MKKTIIAIILCLSFGSQLLAQSEEENAIQELLSKQVACWNNGDIDCFMQYYWHSEKLQTIGKKGVTYGWANILEKYKNGYPTKASMGKLSFDLNSINALGKDHFFVVGKFTLLRQSDNLEGYFSLLIKKIEGKWLIISDHTS